MSLNDFVNSVNFSILIFAILGLAIAIFYLAQKIDEKNQKGK